MLKFPKISSSNFLLTTNLTQKKICPYFSNSSRASCKASHVINNFIPHCKTQIYKNKKTMLKPK